MTPFQGVASFDIELSEELNGKRPGADPLHIACVAVADDGPSGFGRVFCEEPMADGLRASMTKDSLKKVVDVLEGLDRDGYLIVTWNGLGFDWPVLAAGSQEWERCAALARRHVDPAFTMLCTLGYMISLQAASDGMGLPGKMEGIHGADVPKLWWTRQGMEDVLRYVVQDVTATIELYKAITKTGALAWRSKKGRAHAVQLIKEGRFQLVTEAAQLPLPDTSWMSEPRYRKDYTWWLEGR